MQLAVLMKGCQIVELSGGELGRRVVFCSVCFIVDEALRQGCLLDGTFGNCLLCFFVKLG